MPEPKLVEINLNNLGLLKMLDIRVRKMINFGQHVEVLVVDKNNQIYCGNLEKTLVRTESGRMERDLIVSTHRHDAGYLFAGYLFDSEIKELYFKPQII